MHPSPETLNRFLADELNEVEANSIAEHLSDCRQCQDWLEDRALKLQKEIELSQPAMETAHLRIASRIAQSIEASTRDDNTVASVPLSFVRKINSGGMGDVYEYRDNSLDRPVAVKYMRAELREVPELSKRFEREIRIASKLGYRGTPTVLGTSTASDGSLFYWMAFTEGQSLSELLEDSGSPARFADRSDEEIRKKLNWVVEIARIIHRAHLRKILHRDLKPSNVLMDRDGLPVVIDWGLAKEMDDPKPNEEMGLQQSSLKGDDSIASQAFKDTDVGQLTQSDDVVGTPAYIAPEMRQPQAGGDERTDVYGLGGILFEMLVGYPPNYDPATNKPKNEKLSPSPPPRNALAGIASVPPELASICNRALAISPEDRYQTAEEFASDLERFVSSQPVLAHRYTSWQKTARLFSKYSERIVAAVAGLAIVAVAIAIAAVSIDGARRTTQKALDSEQRTLDEATDFSESAMELSSSLQAKLGDTKQFKQFLEQQTSFLNGLDKRAPENPRIAVIHARLFNQEFQSKVNSGRTTTDTEARIREVIGRLQSLSGKGVETDFQLAVAYQNLAIILIRSNQIEKAYDVAEKALELATRYRNDDGQIDQLLLLRALLKKHDCLVERIESLQGQDSSDSKIAEFKEQARIIEVQVVEILEKLPELEDYSTTRRYSIQLARQRVIGYKSASLEKRMAACQAGLAEATQFASDNVLDRYDWMIFTNFQAMLIRKWKGNGVAANYEKELISTLGLLNQCIDFALKLEKGDPIYSDIGDEGLSSARQKMLVQIELYNQGSDRFAVNEFEQTAREIIQLGQNVIDEGIFVDDSKEKIVDWPLTLIDGLMSAKQVDKASRILDLIEGFEKDERQQTRFTNLKAKIASQK